MESDKSTLLEKAGFVYFRGKWIPRLPGKMLLPILKMKFALCNGREVNQMIAELTAALYENERAKNK